MRFRVRGGDGDQTPARMLSNGSSNTNNTSSSESDGNNAAAHITSSHGRHVVVGILSPSKKKLEHERLAAAAAAAAAQPLAAFPSPQKRVVFSSENLRSIRAMLDEARGTSERERSKSPSKIRESSNRRDGDYIRDSSEKTRRERERETERITTTSTVRSGSILPPLPSASPLVKAPTASGLFRPSNPMAPNPSTRYASASSSSSSAESTFSSSRTPVNAAQQLPLRKKRPVLPPPALNGDNSPEQHSIPATPPLGSKRSLLVEVNGSSNINSNVKRQRQRMQTPDNESSIDELGQFDELGMRNNGSVAVRRRRDVEVQSPVTVRRRPSTKRASEVINAENGYMYNEDDNAGELPRRRRGLAIWRLASPPKGRTSTLQAGIEARREREERALEEENNRHGPHAEEYVSVSSGEDEEEGLEKENVKIEQSVEQVGTRGHQEEDDFSGSALEYEGAARIRGVSERPESANTPQPPFQNEVEEAVPAPEDGVRGPEFYNEAPTQSPQSTEATEIDDGGEEEQDENTVPSEEHPLTICGNRLYSDWTGTWDGKPCQVPGVGALFPEGYQPLQGEPDPWICPVRDCQTIFGEAYALGGHFSASHRACLLNDNGDGTLSVVGKRQTKDSETGRMPALVISRKPLDPATAPPKAAPHKPTRKRRASEVRATSASPRKPGSPYKKSRPSPATPRASRNSFLVVDIPTSKSSAAKAAQYKRTEPALWQYLCLYLPHNVSLPTNALILELMSLPRQRELPHRWKLQLAGRPNPNTNLLLAVLIYLAGDKADGEPCKGCRSFKVDGKFPECVVLPDTGISKELRQHFNGRCAGCFYRGLEGCTEEETEETESSTNEDGPALTISTRSSVQSVVGRLLSGSASSRNRVRPSSTFAAVNGTKPRRPLAEISTKTKTPKSRRTQPTSNKVTKSRPASSRASSKASSRPNNKDGQSTTHSAEKFNLAATRTTSSRSREAVSYNMASWEIAPGRISVSTSNNNNNKTENIAFSSTYLLSSFPSAPIPITPYTTFQVLSVQPGNDISWPASGEEGDDDDDDGTNDKTRICSVAQGVVNVRLSGKEFSIGPNGMWKVPAGQGCEVGSVCYGGAVVHVVCVYAVGEEEEKEG